MNALFIIAEAAPTDGGLFGALGIDWRLLIIQIIAFIIMVWVLGKFVYPWLMKAVDDRQATIEAAQKAAQKAEAAAAASQEETVKLLAQARKEAAEIVSTAKLEASTLVSSSEKKAKATAEKIVADAQGQLAKDVAAAKKELYNETLDLVARATRKVVVQTLDEPAQKALIKTALEESR